MFSAIFVIQKSYTGNIFRIGWDKSQSSYFTEGKTEPEGESKTSHGEATPCLGAAQGWPAPRGGGPTSCTASRRLFAYKLPLDLKLRDTEQKSTKKSRRRRHLEPEFGRGLKPRFASPMDHISMGEGSREAMKEGG